MPVDIVQKHSASDRRAKLRQLLDFLYWNLFRVLYIH
jgi:hypothetical protein